MNLFSLQGKTVLLTGASRGLGRGMAAAMAAAGADIIGAGISPMEETRHDVEEAGTAFYSISCDLSDEQERSHLIGKALACTGKIDVLVNNSGIIRRAQAEEYTLTDWHDVLNVNLDAVFLLCREAGKHMIERGSGKIINIASMLSFQGGIKVPAYTASKHAIAGLTKALANEWAGKGVCVNAIAPGYMATDNTEALRNDPDRSSFIKSRIPMGRWGEPADLAGPAVFLASEASNYVSGHILAVDGGWLNY
ncbi:2-dehydro-3-deoxy-D-gluconate 5-dehydrogenase KduD [Metabacillus sp. GX 13764]|uniref:2-dehydro-3-deoxy-D-gluconate 5-dehydrogenase KduD n=1 Tax=Metabacillus kandeliae TaxID=2900151 RepID=UPI001E54CAF7|nr:2-dehydro-3-deoxy-D-gluconate 5-dehydrogenase KduD [Metabacillus kandeliae]MCD7035516.1 2-dehydro-3-deoxy-D-gluconate 5-dehydrogenase KduD [Metabacillus kandeliae]